MDLFSGITRVSGGDIELRRLEPADAGGLRELTDSPEVYRYLPTFLFEKQYDDARDTISRLYGECIKKSLILGVFRNGGFCGLIEVYGYRAPLLKASVGYRLLPRCWGQGTATKALELMTGHLFSETPVRIITASVIPENSASAHVLKKNGFRCVLRSVPENWGHPLPTMTDKWIRTATGYRRKYSFH